jgi:L-threonylcarbamoyladenylate synthase
LTSFIHLDRAARTILDGGVVAYPTEAVYGLGCLPEAGAAALRILQIKRRSWRKGLIVIAADAAQLEPLVDLDASPLKAEILASWPGPATWTLRAHPEVPAWLRGEHDTLAVRVTDHPVARRLCARADSPLVSTSANRGGRPPHRHLLTLRRDLGADVDYVLAAPLGSAARPTTIRDGRTGRVLRGA